jgi:hypothetical protein
LACIFNEPFVQSLFNLEYGINALGWDVEETCLVKDQRRILAIKENNVDLVTQFAVRINDECFFGTISPRQMVP